MYFELSKITSQHYDYIFWSGGNTRLHAMLAGEMPAKAKPDFTE